MITLFCVRPHGQNIGNDTIYLGVRHLVRETFGAGVNLVSVPATGSGLTARTVHEMNLYGHGVIVGGGNVYENGQLDVDLTALDALQPPLMLFSLSHGRIYDRRHALVPRSDTMPDRLIRALHARAAFSVARDEATLAHLHALDCDGAVLGGCPTLLLRQMTLPRNGHGGGRVPGTLLSIRHPQLMSIPLPHQARLHGTMLGLMAALEADRFGPVRVLCHDTRDLAFASSLGDVEYVLADDVYAHLELLRTSSLVVTFRLHAFLPCVSFGTPAVNISYDERSSSLVRTIGLGDWDVDLVRSADVVADVRARCAALDRLEALKRDAQPRWQELEDVMRGAMQGFAARVRAFAAEGPGR